ncbi:hypothetical protein GCM10011344_14760 [Dokdonia pacifica]|uniref:Histidine kinase N-terminal 7TM region domain-containing protein n=1 Tax=Dokdonia pacifica TaxID=1627892 RepID=A0A238W3W0_9FLAO|nr:hypothetical protein [Dokdonia pacifica]GGG15199.1 hypothetical protein GCM10011344_14760 [Dokdonia pacifica]SNR41242.1 hypothetical protein SAMN06265376_101668 [Dokdonia pacifica]
MENFWDVLNTSLLVTQFIAALVGCLYFKRIKNSYWKWFTVYLVLLFISEIVFTFFSDIPMDVNYRYNLFIGLPLEFIFLYWLYGQKSLKNKKLFLVCSALIVVTTLITFSIKNLKDASSLVLNVGSLLLTILIVFEYFKQIRNDDILRFKENKMFYINVGVILFYVGSLPFHVFQKYLYPEYPTLVEYYYVYFLISNCIMYLLFTASFIWGKEQS